MKINVDELSKEVVREDFVAKGQVFEHFCLQVERMKRRLIVVLIGISIRKEDETDSWDDKILSRLPSTWSSNIQTLTCRSGLSDELFAGGR